jgi:hypothetical protein
MMPGRLLKLGRLNSHWLGNVESSVTVLLLDVVFVTIIGHKLDKVICQTFKVVSGE